MSGVCYASKSYIDKHPAAVQAVANAMRKSLAWLATATHEQVADAVKTAEAQSLAEQQAQAKAKQGGAPAWLYRFDYNPTTVLDGRVRAFHCAEMAYAFDNVDRCLNATGGTAVAVTDEALLADQRAVARLEGSFICPEGAACVTAVRQLRESGWLAETDEVVVLNTGTGLIYPDTVPDTVPVLLPSGTIPPVPAPVPA